MPFMQPQVQQGDYYEVETTIGTEVIPADVVGDIMDPDSFVDDEHPRWGEVCGALKDYLEGEPHQHVYRKSGWLARLSAPGYMDCTDWSAHETEEEAREYLKDTYGDDEGEDS